MAGAETPAVGRRLTASDVVAALQDRQFDTGRGGIRLHAVRERFSMPFANGSSLPAYSSIGAESFATSSVQPDFA